MLFVGILMFANILNAITLYVCTFGGSLCIEKDLEEIEHDHHQFRYNILSKIENPKEEISLQNLISMLPKYKEVSKESLSFFDNISLMFIYCDSNDEVLFVAEISFLHSGQIKIVSPSQWKKDLKHFVYNTSDSNDEIFFYIEDNDRYNNFIKYSIITFSSNPELKKDFDQNLRYYKDKNSVLDFFRKNFDILKNHTDQIKKNPK